MQITIEELEQLLGNKDIEIYVLKKQLTEALKKIAEMEQAKQAQ